MTTSSSKSYHRDRDRHQANSIKMAPLNHQPLLLALAQLLLVCAINAHQREHLTMAAPGSTDADKTEAVGPEQPHSEAALQARHRSRLPAALSEPSRFNQHNYDQLQTTNLRNQSTAGSSLELDQGIASMSSLATHTNESEPARDSRNIHFGAKIALTILSATISLVIAATLTDLRHMSTSSKQRRRKLASENYFRSSTSLNSSEAQPIGSSEILCVTPNESSLEMATSNMSDQKHQHLGQRDQRSPSLSSSCSSSLFCSANSLGSASAPILGGRYRRPTSTREGQLEDGGSTLRLQTSKLQHCCQDKTSINQMDKRQLIWQIFLSFSLRHSASIIFQQGSEHSQPENIQHHDKADEEKRSHLLGSRGLMNVLEYQRVNNEISHQHTIPPLTGSEKKGRESIDSLHGLRFLSMIWIIVIHSYNFALRWSVFESSPSLTDLYKSAASQLLANGTFACDSFLFVGGFLMAYLSSPTNQTTKSSRGHSNQAATTTIQDSKEESISTSRRGTLDREDNRHQHQQEQQQQQQQIAASQSSFVLLSTSSSGKPMGLHTNDISCSNVDTEQQHHYNNMNSNVGNKVSTSYSRSSDNNNDNSFTVGKLLGNILHRYIRMMPLMMAIIGLSASLMRYLNDGERWENSTVMFDGWCRDNWWINLLFLHNFLNSSNMCLSHSWYSAVDIQLFLAGQLILFVLFRNKKLGLSLIGALLFIAQMSTGILTLAHNLPAVPLISTYSEQSENLYFNEIYVKPYCRASPYLIGMTLAYLMRTTSLGQLRLTRLQASAGWSLSTATLVAILMAMQPAMNGQAPSQMESALYSAVSRPLWACATGWMIFACMTKNGGIFKEILGAKAFVPLSRLTYPAFLIHPIIIAIFYGSREANSFKFSHYLMLYLILGNILITYASAFILSALFELPLLSVERVIRRAWSTKTTTADPSSSSSNSTLNNQSNQRSSSSLQLSQTSRRQQVNAINKQAAIITTTINSKQTTSSTNNQSK